MARSVFGGEITHLTVSEDAGNADALVVAPSVVVALYNAPAGTLQNDYLLWDGSDYTIPSTTITSNANGQIPAFEGPDGLTELFDATGAVLLARTAGGAADWDTLVDKPSVIAAAATQALARDAIGAASSVEMTTAEAQAGTGTTGLLIEPAVLKDGINRHAPANVYSMPLWDGSGAHPTRVDANGNALPAGFKAHWFQPTAPLTGTVYAVAGYDLWTATAP